MTTSATVTGTLDAGRVPVPRVAPSRARTGRVAGAGAAADGEAAAARGDIGQLTGLRFVAAVWVLAHHASFVPGNAFSPLLEPVRPVLAAGPLGVDLFFALSGFVLARSYLDRWGGVPSPREALSFVWARFARVWPLYALVVVGFGLWCTARLELGGDDVVTWQTHQPSVGPAGWLAQLSMTQLWGSPDIDGISFVLPTWSVSAEWLAYLAFPVLATCAWSLRRAPRPVLAAAAVGAASTAAVAGLVRADVWEWAARLGGGFTAGVLTWLVVRRIAVTPLVERVAQRVVLVALAEIVLVIFWAGSAPATAAVPADVRLLVAVPVFPVLLGGLALCSPSRGIARVLASARLQHGGRISYALYLVHFPLIEVTVVAMTRFPALAPGSSAAMLLVPHVLVASVLVAHLAHRWVEAPAQRWMRAHDPSRRRGGARRDALEGRRASGACRAVGRRACGRAARPGLAPAVSTFAR